MLQQFNTFLRAHPYLERMLAQAGAVNVTKRIAVICLLLSHHAVSWHLQKWAREHTRLVFICVDCTRDSAKGQAGLCSGCAQRCHKSFSHEVICIGEKRNFQ